MKKIIIFIVLSLSSLSQVNSQVIDDRAIDSLKQIITLEKNDSTKVRLLVKFSDYIVFTAPKEALIFAQEGRILARTINFNRGETLCNINIGMAKWVTGDFAEATDIFLKIHEEAKTNKDTLLLWSTFGGITSNYRDQGNHKEALKYAFKAFNTFGKNSYVRIVIGSIYNAMKKPDSALYYLDPNNKTHLVPIVDGYTLSEVAKAYHQKNEYSKALDYYKKSIDILVKSSNIKDLSHAYLGTAQLFAEKGILDSCIHYANRGLEISQKLSYKKGAYESYLVLSEAYELNDKTEALRNYKLAMEVKDDIFNTVKETRLMSARFSSELEQIALEKERDAIQGKLRTNILSGSLFTLSVIAFFLFRNNRLKQKSKLKIEKAYGKLKSTQAQLIQSEKMASLGELTAGIAHEIQNPLNFVNNFSEVSEELLDELTEEINTDSKDDVEEIVSDLKQNLNKISHHGNRASEIVKSMLQHSRTNSGQKELTDINLLADEYLRLSYHGLRAKDKSFNADFKTEFDENLPKIEIVPQDIGRVFLNLINNAFHACTERRLLSGVEVSRSVAPLHPEGGGKNPDYIHKPLVTVQTRQLKNTIEISVKDNGPGIPDHIKDKIFQPFFTTKPTGSGTGLGLSLSYDIVKAHGGELTVKTEESIGTEFTITLFTQS